MIHIVGSTQRLVVYEDMTSLCEMFCIENLKQRLRALSTLKTNVARKEDVEATAGAEAPEEEEEEEQEDLWWIQN